jgi:hypothetical protein
MKPTNTSSKKKKKRKELVSNRRKQRRKVYHPVSSPTKARQKSGDSESDGAVSYEPSGKDTNSNSETEEDDAILVEERKRAADLRKKPPPYAQIAAGVLAEADSSTEVGTEVEAQNNEQAIELRAALIESEAGRSRAEQQVRSISRVQLADDFLIGQVRTWSKEVLWKQCKFITNHNTMNKVMSKAAKKFKVSDEQKDHWMATYAHTVRDGLNQKRNAVAQDLRLTVISKYYTKHCCR